MTQTLYLRAYLCALCVHACGKSNNPRPNHYCTIQLTRHFWKLNNPFNQGGLWHFRQRKGCGHNTLMNQFVIDIFEIYVDICRGEMRKKSVYKIVYSCIVFVFRNIFPLFFSFRSIEWVRKCCSICLYVFRILSKMGKV